MGSTRRAGAYALFELGMGEQMLSQTLKNCLKSLLRKGPLMKT